LKSDLAIPFNIEQDNTFKPVISSGGAKLVHMLSEDEKRLVELISNIVVDQTLKQAYEKSD